MEKYTLELPDEMLEFVTSEAASAGMQGPSDFIRELILEAQRKKAIEEIEALAEHALDSGPATPWTAADKEDILRRLREKYGNPNGAAS
jgi:Arc/MetJ-type ribon-helix-helix transcriptional regulator